jgi:hypothetical protein
MLFETSEDTIQSTVSRLRRIKRLAIPLRLKPPQTLQILVPFRSRLLQQKLGGTQNNCVQFMELTVQFMYASFHYFSIIEYEAEVVRRPEQRGTYCFVFGAES